MATSYPQCPLPADTTCVTYLTRGQSMGLSIATEAGFVSASAVLALFCLITRNVVRYLRNPPEGGWRFFRSPLDVYMLSLLISDLVQGLGKMLDVKWLNDGIVQCGSYCTTQGAIQQVGETSVALATLAIAVQTFIIIFFRKGGEAIRIASLIVCAIWLYVVLYVVISVATHKNQPEYTPTPYWCWVGNHSNGDRLAGEYIWLWLTAFLSLVLYIPLFFCLRGNIETDQESWWKIRVQRSVEAKRPLGESAGVLVDRSRVTPAAAKKASLMLLYPASYIVLVLPISICRWIGTEHIPSAAAFFGTTLLGLSGLVNVVLLLTTRPGLLLLNESVQQPAPGPVFPSSDSLTSTAQEGQNLRLRTLNPMLNLVPDDHDDFGALQNRPKIAGEAA